MTNEQKASILFKQNYNSNAHITIQTALTCPEPMRFYHSPNL